MTRCLLSIDPSSMAVSLMAVLEIDNIFANTDEETADSPGRELSYSSQLTYFLT
jgi:hypothetical protein